jgi:MFS family permease
MAFSSVRPLRQRRFALLFASGAVSNIGTWMETVAVGALIYKETGQASWTSLVAAAAFLPIGLLGPLGGALADRVDRRAFLMAANGFEALVAAVIAAMAFAGAAHPVTVVPLVFLEGCSNALRGPFQQSVLPDIVPREDVFAAISLSQAQFNMGRVVGPALAALVIAVGGFGAAFTVNAISFFAVIAAWLVIGRVPKAPVSDAEAGLGILGLMRSGARIARREPGCRAAIGFIAITGLFVSPFIALIPAKAGLLVGTRTSALASATGLLTTAQGLGALVGAVIVPPIAERFGPRPTVVTSLLIMPMASATFGLAPTTWLAAAALFVLGINMIANMSGLNTVIQLRAPAAARARVLSLFFVALGVLYPVGAVVQGGLADRIGLGATMAGAAVLMVSAVAAIAALRPRMLAALDVVPDAVPYPT